MKMISNAKSGKPVESGTIYRAKIGSMRISVHRIIGCESWFLSCPDFGIDKRELKNENLMGAINESKEILKKAADDMQRIVNKFCESKIEISRY